MSGTIGILIYPDFQLLDAAGPISVFEIAGRFAGCRATIKPIAIAAGPVRSSSGVEMFARNFRSAGALQTQVQGYGVSGSGDLAGTAEPSLVGEGSS